MKETVVRLQNHEVLFVLGGSREIKKLNFPNFDPEGGILSSPKTKLIVVYVIKTGKTKLKILSELTSRIFKAVSIISKRQKEKEDLEVFMARYSYLFQKAYKGLEL